MTNHRRRKRLALVALLAFVVAAASFAFAASNTFSAGAGNAGYGSGTVSGYDVTNVSWDLNNTDPTFVDGVSFDVAPNASEVQARATWTGGDSGWVSCSGGATSFTCTFPANTVGTQALTGLDVASAS